jgi:GNAT superfamily N-acetyltransferase
VTLRVEPCSAEDLELALSPQLPPEVARHHRERFALQADGSAIYLLAWRGRQNVGRATVYAESKYESVRRVHPRAAEINALEANPQRQGTGTALIAAAESLALQRGHTELGLAVEPDNVHARRLYRRLGFVRWDGGEVIDEWIEHRDNGCEVQHRDRCDYLIKSLCC